MPICDDIVDRHTQWYPHHTAFTHFGCAMLRAAMGLALIRPSTAKWLRNFILVVIILSLIVFGFKYYDKVLLKNTIFWKCYPRMLLAYTSALYLMLTNRDAFAGVVIIADALMGVQSRHMASVTSKLTCFKQKN